MLGGWRKIVPCAVRGYWIFIIKAEEVHEKIIVEIGGILYNKVAGELDLTQAKILLVLIISMDKGKIS